MLPRGSKPSSWLISSSIVLWTCKGLIMRWSFLGGSDSHWCYVTSLSPPAPSSNLAPPTASISSKKMRHAFLVLVKQVNLTKGRKKCFPTWPSQRAHGPSWHLHLHTFAPILTRSPCKTEGCHFNVSRKRLRITWWNRHRSCWRPLSHTGFCRCPGGHTTKHPSAAQFQGSQSARGGGGEFPQPWMELIFLFPYFHFWRSLQFLTSLSFSICSLQPPTSLYVTSGFSSTCNHTVSGLVEVRKSGQM